MGRKCAVPECLSEEGREEDRGVTFHKIPLHSDIRPKWMSLCHISDDKYNIKVIHVCSRHFLKADFCHFKGKKYMLRQGVLPSVFPWNKIKREQNVILSPSTVKKEPLQSDNLNDSPDLVSDIVNDDGFVNIKEEVKEEVDIKEEPLEFPDIKDFTNDEIKEQVANNLLYTVNTTDDTIANIKMEVSQNSTTIEQRGKSVQTSTGLLNFGLNTRLEALDFNQTWLPARIIEIDYEEDEVLIHFEKSSSKYDEWISMSSSRLRSLQTLTKKNTAEVFTVGETCMALRNDARKFTARVLKIVDKDTYEVTFTDGYVQILRGHKLSKINTKSGVSAAPLFDPVKGTKQERRDKKRKLNVSELFRKRTRVDTGEESSAVSPLEEGEVWLPKFVQGRPVGIDSAVETPEGQKKSILVADPNLPPDWQKHFVQKVQGPKTGKWETIILSPDGRALRNKTEVKIYLDENSHLKYSESIFSFNVQVRPKSVRHSTPSSDSSPAIAVATAEPVLDSDNSLKIPFIDDAYMCPIEGCGKSFRRVNLAQMHVKHYHPEFTKFLNCTPNVADLAYARTVGESLDKSPVRQVQKSGTPKRSTPKGLSNSPSVQPESSTSSLTNLQSLDNKAKDAEIIRLLNNNPVDENVPKYPPGLPPNMYPDIKLKDLLNKSEGIPKRDDINLKTMSACITRPTGIKTLLPVVRSNETRKESKIDDALELLELDTLAKLNNGKPPYYNKHLKRKRQVSEILDAVKKEKLESIGETMPVQDAPTEPSPNPDYIVEGGEVIKIVRMKREEIINCTCGITEEDGLMIQCEVCLCWQHAYCNNIERENQVPEKYVCYICQNPARQRSSRKYFHDQDWLKTGTLPVANYHCRDNEVLKKRFEDLKKVHDLTGGLHELKDFMHSLKVKIKIAQAKNHPKLYLWSKPWEKQALPEKQEMKSDSEKLKTPSEDISLFPLSANNKNESNSPNKTAESTNMLLSILKTKDEDLNSLSKLDLNALEDISISAPQPEAPIESADCQANLLEHIAHSQSLVEERLKSIEEQVDELDPENMNSEEQYARTCQTVQMLLKDLGTLKELCYSNIL